jgi:hypothetical protein
LSPELEPSSGDERAMIDQLRRRRDEERRSMMPVSWKRREAEAADLFGARRNVLSGSSGRADRDSSDSTHPRIFIETKLRASSAVRTLWERTRILAGKRPRKFQGGLRAPVLVLYDKGKHGALIVVHEADFGEVAAEWLAARCDQELLEIEAAVARRRADEEAIP